MRQFFIPGEGPRGLELLNFSDSYGQECSLQQSSNVETSCWLGVDRGLERRDGTRAEGVRMHLTREMAGELGRQLLKFHETGSITGKIEIWDDEDDHILAEGHYPDEQFVEAADEWFKTTVGEVGQVHNIERIWLREVEEVSLVRCEEGDPGAIPFMRAKYENPESGS